MFQILAQDQQLFRGRGSQLHQSQYLNGTYFYQTQMVERQSQF